MDKRDYISFFNKNIKFDKTTGNFEEVDLFSFLENLSTFDYANRYDDIYYILTYTSGAILNIISNIKKEIKRGYEITHIAKAKEFDKESILYVSKKPGISLKEKLKDGKIKVVKRYESLDTYENRLFKKFLKKIVNILEDRQNLDEFEYLYLKIRKFLRSTEAKEINENKKIVFNNVLLHHKFYKKIFKSYKWLNLLQEKNELITIDKKVLFKLEVLKQLQYFSDIAVLPNVLDVDLEKKSIKLKNSLINFDIEEIYNDNFELNNLKDVVKNILLNQGVELNKDYRFNNNFNEKEVFIDIFRSHPICLVNDEFIEMPLFLKQKIDNKIINANNTKIIDLNKELFTLPEILKTYNVNIFKYFVEDLEKYFKDSHINYIVPDYINLFEFSKIKKIFNTYFKTKLIPKSIAASLDYLFNGKVSENDTLIYIQKNYNDELFITPILVKKDKDKKTLNGLYLEKYPTKKFKDDKSILEGLKNYFDEDIANLLLSKFLQNGLKRFFTIQKESNIKIIKKSNQNKKPMLFLYKDKIIQIPILKTKKIEHTEDEIRSLYNYKQLFNKETIIINDDNKTNLINFKKLLDYEKDGFIVWKEYLIKLAMKIFKDGYFDEFILVNDDSEVFGNEILIKQNFSLPKHEKEISFPLILGEENINYEAYLVSNEMPFDEDVECRLKLIYDFEAENPYELIFIPIQKYKPIKVKWREMEYNNELKYPEYPKKKNLDELKNFIGDKDKTIDLIKWMKDSFKYIENLENNLNNIEEECNLSKEWINNKYQEIDTSVGKVRIYKNKKTERANKIYFKLQRKRRFYEATNIVTDTENYYFRIRVMLPVYNIFKDDFNIKTLDNEFLKLYNLAIKSAINIKKSRFENKLSLEVFYFLNCIHYEPSIKELVFLMDKNYKQYRDNVTYAIGCLNNEYQKQLFQKVLEKLTSNNEETFSNSLKILGVALFRCEKLLDYLKEKEIILIIDKLLISLKRKSKTSELYFTIKKEKIIKKSVAMRLELLLALLRLREKNPNFLHPKEEITKKFISILDKITKKIITQNLKFNSRVELEVDKPKEFERTPTLLYALRLYLSGDVKANNIKILGVADNE